MTDAPQAAPGRLLPADHNQAPADADPLLDRLNEQYDALLGLGADLELEILKLPKAADIQSDDDAQKIVAMVARFKEGMKKAEEARKEEKEDSLRRGQKIDGFFKGIREPLEERMKEIERRLTPYLTRKAAEEEARRRAAAEEARKAEEEAAQRRREEEQAAAAAAAQAEEAAARLRQAATEEERVQAADDLQAAETNRQLSQDAATQAATDEAKVGRQADRHESVASRGTGRLSRTSGEAGSASVKTAYVHSITDPDAFLASLGPLGPHISSSDLSDALKRVARGYPEDKLAIPGVTFNPEISARTRT